MAGLHRLSVMLDVDAGTCRLGYGTEEGLRLLHETAMRLGTLVSNHLYYPEHDLTNTIAPRRT
jgi:hypothetical protein